MRAEKTLVLKTLSMVKSNSDILNEETCHQNYNTKQQQKKSFEYPVHTLDSVEQNPMSMGKFFQ